MRKDNFRDINKILVCWNEKIGNDIEEENITYEINRETHIWTVNKKYILKMTNSKDEVENNINLIKTLERVNVPTQKIIKTINKEDYVKVEDRYFALFTKIEGQVLKDYFEKDYLKRAYYLGESIGNLHNGLKNIEGKDLWNNNMIDELNGWVDIEIQKYIKRCRLDKQEIEKFTVTYKEIKSNFDSVYAKLPRQIIHRDMQGENLIFKNEKLVGYIDFDLSQINARIYDVCYLCTASLNSVFNSDKRNQWKAFAEEVIEGYDNVVNITIEERDAVKGMFLLIELIMIAYFAQNNCGDIADRNVEMFNWINDVWN